MFKNNKDCGYCFHLSQTEFEEGKIMFPKDDC
jgi:hypothetical protein